MRLLGWLTGLAAGHAREHARLVGIAVGAVIALFLAAPAGAQYGVNLSWDDCTGSGNETYDKTVPCADEGVFSMIGSFVSPVALARFAAADAYLDLIVEPPGLPSWWQASSERYGVTSTNVTGAACEADVWEQAPSGVFTFVPTATQISPSRLRIRVAKVFAVGEEQPIEAGFEYYAFTLQLKFSPGTADDPGCQRPACFSLVWMNLLQPDTYTVSLEGPAFQQWVGWRGYLTHDLCYVSTRRTTWGSLKTLYR